MPSNRPYHYLKVSQGFVNTVIYLRVPADKVEEVDLLFADYADDGSGRHTSWTHDRIARAPGIAVDWADRAYVGL